MAHRQGHGTLLHRGRSVTLAPGTMLAMDTTSPYRLTFHSAFAQDILRLPVAALDGAESNLAQLTAAPVNPGLAREWLVAGLSQHVFANGDEPELEAPLLDLARMALTGHATSVGRFQPAPDRLTQARHYIRYNLRSQQLSPASVASALGISLRTLQKAFADVDDHPSACIARERLQHASEDLVDPRRSHRAIALVAADWGFADASHFIRAFRAQFGVTPGQWRRKRIEKSGDASR